MWHGVTEQNISKAFREAESNDAILFLDEADSMLSSRGSHRQSFENSHTNELLCGMENFKGIFFCATNFLSLLDRAALRRFTWKIKFMNMTPKAIVELFKDTYNLPLNEKQKYRLKALSGLNVGDFKVVRQKLVFKKEVVVDDILDMLETESKYKENSNKVMGL